MKSVGLFWLLPWLTLVALAGAASPPSLPLPSEVGARAQRELPTWREKMAGARPRLFFTAESWRRLRDRYAASTGQERLYFEAALARARQIVTQLRPVYRTPEEMRRVDTELTPISAQEELWERRVGDDLVTLSFALAVTGDAETRGKLHECVLTACSYPSWGWPGQEICNRDLACGHLARGIAIAYDWHPDIWSEADRTLIRGTIRARAEALKAGAYGGVSWAGHYDQNHLQVSVCGLGLCGLAFLDEIPEAAEWTALALTSFEQVARASNADGTSEEGVPYWSYGLSYTMQFIEGTQPVLGTRALYDAPFFRHGISARLQASTPGLAGTLPWGDAVPRDFCGPHAMLYRLASEYRDGSGQILAASLPFAPTGGSDGDVWTALWYDPDLTAKSAAALDYHGEVAGIVNTRSGWGAGDYLLSFKTGFTNVNHGHLDSGALAFCFGNDWLLKAPGYGTGKGEGSFWDRHKGRWAYLSNSTESHSTLLVNGRNQRTDFEARSTIDACVFSPGWVWTSADLSGAYEDVNQVRRGVLHRRGEYVFVFDEVTTPAEATVEWLAQVPPDATVNGDRLTAKGNAGALEIRSLLPPDQAFVPRPPTREKNDVPAKRLNTYTLTQKGTTLRFATALIPRFGVGVARIEKLEADEKSGRQEFTVTGAAWRDNVTFDPAPDAKARVLAIRRKGERVDSLLAAGATEIPVGDLSLLLSARADLALQTTLTGDWELDAGTALELLAPLPAGWRLVPTDPGQPPASVKHFPAGHYSLQKSP